MGDRSAGCRVNRGIRLAVTGTVKIQGMAEPVDNPYAAPSFPADGPPVKPPQPIPLINRIVSTALFTVATFLLVGIGGATLFTPISNPPTAWANFVAVTTNTIVISGLYAIGFWLRRRKPS